MRIHKGIPPATHFLRTPKPLHAQKGGVNGLGGECVRGNYPVIAYVVGHLNNERCIRSQRDGRWQPEDLWVSQSGYDDVTRAC